MPRRKKHNTRSRKNFDYLINGREKKNTVIDLIEQVKAASKKQEAQEISDRELALADELEYKNREVLGQVSSEESEYKAFQVIKTEKKAKDENKLSAGDFLNSDEKVKCFINTGETIESFLGIIKTAREQLEYCHNRFTEADRRRVDIEHNIELEYENCYQTFLIARQMKKTLIERRDYKDLYNLLQIIVQFADSNQGLIEKTEKLLFQIQKNEALRQNRIYVPRTDIDLPVTEEFKKLSAQEQYLLKQKREKGIA